MYSGGELAVGDEGRERDSEEAEVSSRLAESARDDMCWGGGAECVCGWRVVFGFESGFGFEFGLRVSNTMPRCSSFRRMLGLLAMSCARCAGLHGLSASLLMCVQSGSAALSMCTAGAASGVVSVAQ